MDTLLRLVSTAGVSDTAVRLLLALFLSTVSGLVYSISNLRQWTRTKQHLYFTFSGVSLAYLCYKLDIIHSVISQLVVYLALHFLPGRGSCVAVVWLFSMTYLLAGYISVATEKYVVTWTVSQCVLTLKFIGTAFDLRDGRKASDGDRKCQPEAIEAPPTLIEWFGYCFFPATLFVGPAFPFRRYKDFVEGRLFPGGIPSTLLPTLKSMFLGVVCLCVHLGLSGTFSANYFLTDEYAALAVMTQLLYIYFWIRVYSFRYVGIWLISDSGCVASGIGYNGIGTNSQTLQWNALSNVNLYYLETDVTLNSGPRSFNVQTNIWILRYVYKRLRFLGSKHISIVLSLVFLSVWHGVHAGYFLTFVATELPLLIMERVTLEYASKFVQVEILSPVSKRILMFFGYIWRWTAIGYTVIPFEQKHLDRGLKALKASHFLFHVVFIIWTVCVVIYLMLSCQFLTRKKVGDENGILNWSSLSHDFGENRDIPLCAQQNGEVTSRSSTEDNGLPPAEHHLDDSLISLGLKREVWSHTKKDD